MFLTIYYLGSGVMRGLVMVFCAFVIFASTARAEPLDPDAFTTAFAKAAAAAIPTAKVTVTGRLQTDTRNAKGETTTSDLRNAYSRYVEHPQALDEIIQRYVGVLADSVRLADAPAPDRSRIVPVFKPRQWLEGLRQERKIQNIQQAPEPLTEPYNAELTIAYAEDLPSSIRFLTTRDDVGDPAKLHNLALANLNRLVPKIEMRAGADGISLISAGGQFESSLLLADNIWSSGQIKVDGDVVVAVPAKDALLVTGLGNQAGLKRLRAIAAELAARPFGLSKALFVYRDGKFVKFAE